MFWKIICRRNGLFSWRIRDTFSTKGIKFNVNDIYIKSSIKIKVFLQNSISKFSVNVLVSIWKHFFYIFQNGHKVCQSNNLKSRIHIKNVYIIWLEWRVYKVARLQQQYLNKIKLGLNLYHLRQIISVALFCHIDSKV
jgi:hypothetical protein